MGKGRIVLLVVLILLGVCLGSDGNVVELGCFFYEKNGDYIQLFILNLGVELKGELDYFILEKDKNVGSVCGF